MSKITRKTLATAAFATLLAGAGYAVIRAAYNSHQLWAPVVLDKLTGAAGRVEEFAATVRTLATGKDPLAQMAYDEFDRLVFRAIIGGDGQSLEELSEAIIGSTFAGNDDATQVLPAMTPSLLLICDQLIGSDTRSPLTMLGPDPLAEPLPPNQAHTEG